MLINQAAFKFSQANQKVQVPKTHAVIQCNWPPSLQGGGWIQPILWVHQRIRHLRLGPRWDTSGSQIQALGASSIDVDRIGSEKKLVAIMKVSVSLSHLFA